jgi:hypothetical protein
LRCEAKEPNEPRACFPPTAVDPAGEIGREQDQRLVEDWRTGGAAKDSDELRSGAEAAPDPRQEHPHGWHTAQQHNDGMKDGPDESDQRARLTTPQRNADDQDGTDRRLSGEPTKDCGELRTGTDETPSTSQQHQDRSHTPDENDDRVEDGPRERDPRAGLTTRWPTLREEDQDCTDPPSQDNNWVNDRLTKLRVDERPSARWRPDHQDGANRRLDSGTAQWRDALDPNVPQLAAKVLAPTGELPGEQDQNLAEERLSSKAPGDLEELATILTVSPDPAHI